MARKKFIIKPGDKNKMLEIKNLYFSYESEPQKNILEDINLKIEPGELISIMGSNGSGKSTFARLLNYLLKKKSGLIIADNLNYDDLDNIYKIRSKISMVFQNPDNQIISNIIQEDIAFGPENLNLDREEINSRVDKSLKIMGLLDYKNFLVNMLSGGQKQKVAIAGILAMNPDYIIFDESTSMIDNKQEILDQIFNLNKTYGKTIIFITHDIQEAIKFKRLIILDKSKIIFDDTPENIFCREKFSLDNINLDLDTPFSIKFIDALEKNNINLDKTLDINKLAELIAQKIFLD